MVTLGASGGRGGCTGTLCSWCALLGKPPQPRSPLLFPWPANQIQPPHNQQMWVTDLVSLHDTKLVATASTDQKRGECPTRLWPLGVMHLHLEMSVAEVTLSMD